VNTRLAALLALAPLASALAQSTSAPPSSTPASPPASSSASSPLAKEAQKDPSDWTLRLEPSVWYVAPGGKLRMPGSPSSFGLSRLEKLNLDSPRPMPYLEAQWKNEDWKLTLSTSYASERNRGAIADEGGFLGPISYAPGDRINSSLSIFNLELNAAHRLSLPKELAGDPSGGFASRLEVLGGIRLQHFDADFDVNGANVSASEFFGFPVVGARFSMELIRRFTLDLQVDAGGFAFGGGRAAWGANIISGFQYRPTENIGIQIGYRLMSYHTRTGRDTDRFEYNGALAGLFFGAVVRF